MAIDVEKLELGQRIELYIKPGCPSCEEAESFYRRKGISIEIHNAQDDPVMKQKMLDLARGNPTTPAIVIDGKYAQSGWGRPPRG
jgi:glutaredoxin